MKVIKMVHLFFNQAEQFEIFIYFCTHEKIESAFLAIPLETKASVCNRSMFPYCWTLVGFGHRQKFGVDSTISVQSRNISTFHCKHRIDLLLL